MSTFYCSGIVVITALVLPAAARGQSAVEYGASAARSSATATPARSAGKSARSIFGSAQKRLQQAAKAGGAQAPAKPVMIDVPRATGTKTAARAPTVKFGTACVDDPGKIAAGMPYDELISACGTPAVITADAAGGTKLLYTAGPKDLIVVVSGGQVESVKAAHKSEPLDVVVLR